MFSKVHMVTVATGLFPAKMVWVVSVHGRLDEAQRSLAEVKRKIREFKELLPRESGLQTMLHFKGLPRDVMKALAKRIPVEVHTHSLPCDQTLWRFLCTAYDEPGDEVGNV